MPRPLFALVLVALLGTSIPLPAAPVRVETADVCIYGGTAAGVIAAVATARLGRSAIVIEPGEHLGGLTSGGLGQTDIGNKGAIGGISREFYRRVRDHYAHRYGIASPQYADCTGGFRFEPHVAENILNQMLAESGARAVLRTRLVRAKRRGNRIVELLGSTGVVFRAAVFVDAGYEGDLMAAAGVRYTVGREANQRYGETLNGVQFGQGKHNFTRQVDPYVVPGNPGSGLLPGITAYDGAPNGSADHRVQAYCYRMCLTRAADRIPFPKPADYDPARYELYGRYLHAGVFEIFGNSQPMPNGKTDTNNHGAIATDNIGRNYAYPDGDQVTRERIIRDHISYQQGLMWFLCNDPRVPEGVRSTVSQWGLARDEFQDTGGWPHQLYVREARRMVSDTVMTEHHCRGARTVPDSIGLAAYGMDSHHVQRVVKDGQIINEGDVQVGGFSPYPISYRSIHPVVAECVNLLVPVCLSASHIAYGSIRMEPVFMVLGQSAATAAVMAIERGCTIQQVPVGELQERLRLGGQILQWSAPRVAVLDPTRLRGLVLDDRDAVREGEWPESTRGSERRVGTGYVHDGNVGKGEKSARWTVRVPAAGEYEIYLVHVPNENRATNVPVELRSGSAPAMVVRVNQRSAFGDGFSPLGRVKLSPDVPLLVTVRTAGTDGFVVLDGLQVVPVGVPGGYP